MRDDPLIIFCSPRGGSSLVASTFVNHGFWTGTTYSFNSNPKIGGYETHENAAIKQWFKLHFKLDAGYHGAPKSDQAKRDASRADLGAFCKTVVPADQLWLWKGTSEYYPVCRAAFPRMRAVMVYRDRTQAVEAHVRRRGEKVRQGAAEIVSQRYDFMDATMKADPLSWRVDADRIVDGDLAQLTPVLAQYRIDLDHRLAMKDISPDLFHR